MLSAVAALAQSIYPDDDVDIYLGAHADDAAGDAYADCSQEFTDAMTEAINICLLYTSPSPRDTR